MKLRVTGADVRRRIDLKKKKNNLKKKKKARNYTKLKAEFGGAEPASNRH